jgi:hypothetical protein
MSINDLKMNYVLQGNLMQNVQGAMIFPDKSQVLAPSWHASVNI